MKKFTHIFNEGWNENDPGNQLVKTGVSNHYTPVENILTNIRNLFCVQLSIVAIKGEDDFSIKLTSSRFTSEKAINDLLYTTLYNDTFSQSNLYNYITSQGLTKVTKVNLGGGYWVVYFSPEDIKAAEDPASTCCDPGCCGGDCYGCDCPCPCEANESMYNEFEYTNLITEDDGEEELKSETLQKVLELLDGPDKVKAAKQLELLVSNEIQLPREYYFSAIKFKSGEEAIALRWKYTKKMPFGKGEKEGEYKETTVENTRSIMHIFGKGDMAIWVQDFAKDSLVELPDDVKKLIKSILDLLEAEETDTKGVYSLTGERKERKDKDEDKKDDDKDKDEDKEDKKEDDKDKKEDKDKNEDEDSESDEDRGDNSDDLLG